VSDDLQLNSTLKVVIGQPLNVNIELHFDTSIGSEKMHYAMEFTTKKWLRRSCVFIGDFARLSAKGTFCKIHFQPILADYPGIFETLPIRSC